MAVAVPLPASTPPAVPARARAVRVRLDGALPAAHAALLTLGDAHAVALTGGWAGVSAVVAGEPVVVLGAGEDPFAALDRQPEIDPDGDPDVRVGGGWFGALGYALGALCEPAEPPPPRGLALPAAPLAFHDHVLVCEDDGAWFFEALWTPERNAALHARRDELAARLVAAPAPGRVRLHGVAARAPGAAGHLAAVAECRERIAAGEIFQANLCLHLEGRLDGRPEDLAAVAADTLGPAHGALVRGPWGAAVSASPELFLRRVGREVRSAPIKGTAPTTMHGELAGSEKDRAENVMIVDLMRNDLGRVCAFGSVVVEALAEPRPGAGVWHLVSEVRGELRPEVGDGELLRATFPPGSVTGAPKVQALRVIAELEGSARELYTGAIGYASPFAGVELSVAIRTFELTRGRFRLSVGGGITAGSDPAAELEECLVKARPLLALGGAERAVESSIVLTPREKTTTRRIAALPRALADRRERPDPARGLFETVLVRDGAPRRLEAHLARLAASAGALYGLALPDGLARDVRRAAAGETGARLRLDLAPDGSTSITTSALPDAATEPVRLVPVLLPGGLGAHKWADRRLLDALVADLQGVPLLVDADGAVLEAAWASVWLREDRTWTTPRADGRLLGGVARAALLAEGGVEGDVSLERLAAADAVAISTALRGRVPATLATPARR